MSDFENGFYIMKHKVHKSKYLIEFIPIFNCMERTVLNVYFQMIKIFNTNDFK